MDSAEFEAVIAELDPNMVSMLRTLCGRMVRHASNHITRAAAHLLGGPLLPVVRTIALADR